MVQRVIIQIQMAICRIEKLGLNEWMQSILFGIPDHDDRNYTVWLANPCTHVPLYALKWLRHTHTHASAELSSLSRFISVPIVVAIKWYIWVFLVLPILLHPVLLTPILPINSSFQSTYHPYTHTYSNGYLKSCVQPESHPILFDYLPHNRLLFVTSQSYY